MKKKIYTNKYNNKEKKIIRIKILFKFKRYYKIES